MKTTRLIPVILIILLAMTIIAFAGGEPAANPIENIDDPVVTEPDLQEPDVNTNPPVYTGKILSILEDGSLLTEGAKGINGLVVVHLPESIDSSIKFTEDAYLTMYYDGSIAESELLHIWSESIQSVEETHYADKSLA